MGTDRRTIELPGDLVERIEARVPHTEFDDADAYVGHVVEEVLLHVQREHDLGDDDAVDEQQVQERLKSLGYLNE